MASGVVNSTPDTDASLEGTGSLGWFWLVSEIGPHISQADLIAKDNFELVLLLPECWENKHMPPC